jgi:hypothetical protein
MTGEASSAAVPAGSSGRVSPPCAGLCSLITSLDLNIHRDAEKAYSRKPLFTLSDAYALGTVLRADSSHEERF